jgi:Vitamin K-dependent gamma-carboxylase
MSPVIGYLASFMVTASERWNAFWYTPADPTLLGMIRILTGLMLLYTHAVWGLALNDFLGPDGWISRDLVELVQSNQFAYSVWWLVPAEWLWPAYAAMMVILALFTVGLSTRATSLLSLLIVISFVNRVPETLFGLDKLNVILTFYLAIGPSGTALSLDRWLARRWRAGQPSRPLTSVSAAFVLRLIQVHMCIVYFFAGISKLQGVAWWNGQAMWLAFGNLEYQSADMTWLAWHPWVVNFMTHFTALWELSFCVLVWIPLLRPLVLIATVFLHVGIGACLGLWTFSLIMLVGCASFLPTEGVARLVTTLTAREKTRAAGS